jgi:hypothetical protein
VKYVTSISLPATKNVLRPNENAVHKGPGYIKARVHPIRSEVCGIHPWKRRGRLTFVDEHVQHRSLGHVNFYQKTGTSII